MTSHSHAATARPADIASRQRDVHKRTIGAVVVVAPDQTFLIGEHRSPTRTTLLRLCDPLRRLSNLVDGETGDASRFFQAGLVGSNCLVEVLGRSRYESFVDPSLICDVGEPSVEQREVRAGINRKMHDSIL